MPFNCPAPVDIDTDKVDDAVLALLYLGPHERQGAWKGLDWEAMRRLHAKGYIDDPLNKAKSVLFAAGGVRASQRALRKLFGRGAQDG